VHNALNVIAECAIGALCLLGLSALCFDPLDVVHWDDDEIIEDEEITHGD